MKRVIIFKAAQVRLGEIWDYTCEKWDEDQADTYLRKLGSCMETLVRQRHHWRSVKDKRLPDVFFIRCEHHFIFFRELPEQIVILSILHESMNMVQRRRDDLEER